jgi:hypothetical protein
VSRRGTAHHQEGHEECSAQVHVEFSGFQGSNVLRSVVPSKNAGKEALSM